MAITIDRRTARVVVGRRSRLHGGHAHVMHAGDAQADDDGGFQALQCQRGLLLR
jgi:hypothetical protein